MWSFNVHVHNQTVYLLFGLKSSISYFCHQGARQNISQDDEFQQFYQILPLYFTILRTFYDHLEIMIVLKPRKFVLRNGFFGKGEATDCAENLKISSCSCRLILFVLYISQVLIVNLSSMTRISRKKLISFNEEHN